MCSISKSITVYKFPYIYIYLAIKKLPKVDFEADHNDEFQPLIKNIKSFGRTLIKKDPGLVFMTRG